MYELQGISKTIWNNRYAFYEGETWPQGGQRVAEHVARNESDFVRWSDTYYSLITNGYFMPGGRIWYGSGRPRGQLLNCFVIPSEDSREGWARLVGENIIISGTGGGVGANYSNVRPRNTVIKGTGGYATGSVSLMHIVDAAGEVIKGGGGRRVANMMCLNINHGDIEEFLEVKLDLKKLNNANISVVFNEDPQEFFALVEQGENLEISWQGQVIKSIPARKLWEKIVSNSLRAGEPGLLNGYYANKQNNLWYCRTLVSTNPCGEIWMQPYSTCCLGAVVLPRIVKESKSYDLRNHIDWEALHHTVTTGIRFLDDVLDVNHYPIPELQEESMRCRRIGLGTMGLHHMLLLLGLKYSSPEGREFTEKIAQFIKHTAYDASISLAIEKGVFPLYDERALDGGFIKSLKPSIRNKIRTHGLHNCALLTIAPTGTTSMVVPWHESISGTTSGIEAMFAEGYLRRYYDGDVIASEVVVDPLFKLFVSNGKSVEHFESSADITPEDHLKMQVIWQQNIDNAISKTINIPQGQYNEERLSKLYMEYFPQLKGMTIYPEGSRENQPLTRLPKEKVISQIMNGVVKEEVLENDCPTGICTI